jgi:hypothetical protein
VTLSSEHNYLENVYSFLKSGAGFSENGEVTTPDEPKIGVFFLHSDTPPTSFIPMQKVFASNTTLDLRMDLSIDDAQYEVKLGRKCILVFTIGSREELTAALNAILALKNETKSRKAMIVIFMKNSNQKVDELLIRSGCSEVIDFQVSFKAASHKINRYVKLIAQDAPEIIADVELTNKKGDALTDEAIAVRGRSSANPTPTFSVSISRAWEGQDDFWLFRKKVYAKKYKEFWLIEIIGPSPAAGKWVEITKDRWQWQTRPGFDLFSAQKGNWEFAGFEPKYDWTINRWGLVSSAPALELVEASQIIYSRFFLADSNSLIVPENSAFALSLFQKMKETYDKQHLIHGTETKELHGVFGKDSEIPWADRTNSNDLKASDWNLLDTAEAEAPMRPNLREHILTGAKAMEACELKGSIKSIEVSLIEYNLTEFVVSMPLTENHVTYKEAIELIVKPENLNLPPEIKIRGLVMGIEKQEEFGQLCATVMILENSKDDFYKIRAAMNQRQTDVLTFFKKAKGVA